MTQVLELQNTLDDLTHRVDKVKEENLKLKSENTVLGQYIENLMQASQVFQAVSPKSRRSAYIGTEGPTIKKKQSLRYPKFGNNTLIPKSLFQEAQATKSWKCYQVHG